MRQAKKTIPILSTPTQTSGVVAWRVLLWLIFAGNSLFFLPQCLDRSLAPRFFFLSAALLVGMFLIWKALREKADWRLHGFDLLLLAWYGLHLASIGWAFSWSEAVFYTQKVLLLWLTYWLVWQSFRSDENTTRTTFRQATTLLTFAVSGILLVQLGLAVAEHGLDNERLYALDWFLFGNKSLTTEFLFFLLVFNILFWTDKARNWANWLSVALLTALILLLQTRTVYLALIAGALVYFPLKAFWEPDFAKVFREKILAAGFVALGMLAGFLALKGTGSSLAERLNPFTYLESTTANERRFVWYKTDLLNADHFWLGVGSGSWKFWFPSKSIEGGYRLQEQNVVFTRAHNDYLEVRAEMGIVGVTLFCAVFGAIFLAIFWKLRRPETDAKTRNELLVLAAGLLGYCVIQYFDFPRERIEMQVFLAILFAFSVFHTRDLWSRMPGIFIGKFKSRFLLLAAGGLLFNLAIGWNRIQGEIHNVRMMQALVKRNFPQMLAEARAAKNRFYEYNDVAIPLDWYEGVAFYQMNQPEKSVEAFERAYRLNPWSFQVINNYASALVQAKRFSDAIPLYEKVLAINPRYEDGKYNLAYTWYLTGDDLKARDWLARIDTIANPRSEEERQKNASMQQRKTELQKLIESR
ncbi:MAG: hypothetical protein OHK0019_02920 [Saprospiraceae bacterium]